MAKKTAKKTGKKAAKKSAGKTVKKKTKAAIKKGGGTAGASGNGAATAASGARLLPPAGCVTVRFYRIGHGDCFLIAFPGESPTKPAYVLIDCGYKPGSPGKINPPGAAAPSARKIWANIREATGGHIDVAVITHEHQDHVNGFTKTNLGDVTVGQVWLAWTEDPEDDVANQLRATYKDKLVGLAAARMRLAAAGEDNLAEDIDKFLEFELGGDDEEQFSFATATAALAATAAAPARGNKASMALLKKLAPDGPKFFRPHETAETLPGTSDVRVFALGPPRNPDLMKDMDPQGDEVFHLQGVESASPGRFFAAAAAATPESPVPPLFAKRYSVPWDKAMTDSRSGEFFTAHYGREDAADETAGEEPSAKAEQEVAASKGTGEAEAKDAVPKAEVSKDEAGDDAPWRRIDGDWLGSAGQFALDLNTYTNNTSLVLAFELGAGGKVLLFAADAQRGNWITWADGGWDDNGRSVSTRDLLARSVLYKVGHHCSHNATLNGNAQDDHANLSWMAQGEHAQEFTAMITAVWDWAKDQNGWEHPFGPIKDALLAKASGRVFQTDTDFDEMEKPANASQAGWDRFRSRVATDPLYFDYSIPM